MVFFEIISSFLFGALGYGTLELFWRGHTHWSMLLTGGTCFSLIYFVATRSKEALWKKWVMSAALITTLEFLVGCIVNLRLGWDVWDYSGEKYNLLGQICPLFSFLWFLLCIPCTAFSKACNRFFFKKSNIKPSCQ